MFETLIYQLEETTEHEQQLSLLAEIEDALDNQDSRKRRLLKSLLYHRNWYIRREAAFLVDRYGVSLNAEERLQFSYALQNFTYLQKRMEEGDRQARRLLFAACADASPRIRSRVLAQLTIEQCQSIAEEVWLHYAAGDYLTLLELGSAADYRSAVIEVLQHGLNQKENPTYHRRQCAFCLEQLRAMDDAGEAIRQILKEQNIDAGAEERTPILPPPQLTPLEQLLHFLRQQGVWVDGKQIFPEIEVGTVTGRVVYRNPALQTWSAVQRWQHIQPPPGQQLIRLDYVNIEPRILLHFLLERFLISTEDVPPGDLYLAVCPTDRQQGKQWFNAVINGGGYRYARELNPFQEKLWQAIRELRTELVEEAEQQGAVVLPNGKRLPLPEGERNRAGRIMNRFIQGTASEIFNQAASQLYLRFTSQMLPAQVYFLLFDELWIACSPAACTQIESLCREEMHRAVQNMGLLVNIEVRKQEEPA